MNNSIKAIRYPIVIDSSLGELGLEHDYAKHIEQLIKQVLFTNPGERINRPDFGCGLRRMVFAPNSEVTGTLTQVTVYQALEKWLGTLIRVDKVEVKAVEERLEVRIAYALRARQERRYLNLEVTL